MRRRTGLLLLLAAAVVAVVVWLAVRGGEAPPAASLPAGNGYARDAAVAPDGTVVVGGEAYPRLVLARYRADGTLERVATAPGAQLAAVTPGLALASRLAGGRYRPELVRLTPGGEVGRVTSTALGDGDAFGRALAVRPGGRAVVASDARRGDRRVVAVTRYDGRDAPLGTTFVAIPGRALTAAGIALGADGTIVVAGTAFDSASGASEPFVARLSPAGVPLGRPATLRSGAAGTVASALALDASGRPVVAASGRVRGRSVFLAVRPGGATAVPVGAGDAYASDVAIGPGGRILLAGTAGGRGALVRLSGSGAVESKRLVADAQVTALALDGRGHAFVAGSTVVGRRARFALTRVDAR